MVKEQVVTIGRVPVSTWVTLAAFALTVLTGAGKFIINDAVQTDKIASIEKKLAENEVVNTDIRNMLYDIRERLVRIETQVGAKP